MKKNNLLKNLISYYNSLSILKKFLIPSILGFLFFLIFYIYILSNTGYMKQTIHKINTESIPIYETIFDNEILLQKISYELHSAVVSKELDWIKETNIHAEKILKNLNKFTNSSLKNNLFNIKKSFQDYYDNALPLAQDLILKHEDYDEIHNKTTLVIVKYNKILNEFQKLREKLKNDIKYNINSTHATSSTILFNSSYAFIIWIILSALTLLYIYRDMKSRIYQIVEQSESIALGEANFHKRLSSKSSDELGLVVNSINIFISKLEKNHEELEVARDDIKRFITDTVHQTRTPLASILINAEMIKELQQDESLTTYIDSIDASINMLSNSYEDLSYITSYDSIQYKASNISLSNTLENRIEFFETICKMNLKQIKSNISLDINTLINIHECERIIDNNISNAIKYANINKDIYINLYKAKEENKIILEFKSYADEIKNKKKIFQKNYREEDSKKGLGLGLNIVKTICDKYNIAYVASYQNGLNIFTYTFESIEKNS